MPRHWECSGRKVGPFRSLRIQNGTVAGDRRACNQGVPLLTWDLRSGLGSPGKEGGEKVAGKRDWWPNWSRTGSGRCAGFEVAPGEAEC